MRLHPFRRGLWLGSFALVFAVVAGFLAAEPPRPVSPERVKELVHNLGASEYRERESASNELLALGEEVLPHLQRAAGGSDDPEVRQRAQRLLRHILWAARKSKSTDLELVPLTPGEFRMGSPRNEAGRGIEETQHTVKITRTFLCGVHEVTQAQYEKVTGGTPSTFAASGSGSGRVAGLDTTRFPVEGVSWYDAILFCNALSELDGFPPYYKLANVEQWFWIVWHADVTTTGSRGYRLLTEAEWEYACRGGRERRFHFGGMNTGREANVKPDPGAGGYGGPPDWKPLNRTAKVGSYKPNDWGVYDTHGNVGEWCWDWYDTDYYANSPGENPLGPPNGKQKVTRGGSWLVTESSARCASRTGLTPTERKEYVGFRVARTP